MPEQTKRQQLETHLATRATQDPDFRERLLREPKRVIEQEIGLKFPEGLQISVHEEKLNQLCVILPVDLLTTEDLLPHDIGSDESAADETPFWKRLKRRKTM
jgi:hypothetical protein